MKSELAAWLLQVLGEEKGRADAQARWADGWLDPEPRFGQSNGFVGPPVRPNHDQILADIEAKRALVANCVTWIEGEPENAWYDGGRPQDLADQTLRLLGSGYADRRGYRYEWKPRP